MVPVLNWTPSSSGPSQSQDSGARKPCRGRTESVLTKEQLGSHSVVRERVLGVSILLHRPFLFLSLKAPSEGRSHGHPLSSRSLGEYLILRESGTQALETTGGLGSPSTHLKQTFLEGTTEG